jgi:hypothetical protein
MSIILRSHPGLVHSMTQETDAGSYKDRIRNAGPSSVAVSTPQVKYGVRFPKFIWAPETPQLPLLPAFGLIYDQPR